MTTSKSVRRRAIIAGTCLVAVLGAGVGTWAIVAPPTSSAAAEPAHRSTRTVPVTRGDLTESRVFSGTLGYGAPVGLTGAATGIITALPTPGQVIHRDEALYAVDERPVRSMYGTVPLWRELVSGLRGADVAQLNSNLKALGYDVVEDDVFGPRTRAAVRQWQGDRALPKTGRITADQVAFVDGDVRVQSVDGKLGQAPSGDVLQLTSTKRVVTTTVAEQDADQLAVGTPVTVRINGAGRTVQGTVVHAEPASGEEGDSGGEKVAVSVALSAGDTDLPAAASAQVTVAGETERDVLTVPVSALVASGRAGRYVVVVVRGQAEQRVPVTAGFVANGRVVITGKVREGDRVEVPR